MKADRFALPVALMLAATVAVAGCDSTPAVSAAAQSVPATNQRCEPATLLTCLLSAPSGSRETVRIDTPAAMTAQQFVDAYYAQAPQSQRNDEVALLPKLGVRSIAGDGWLANDDHINIVLLQFGTPAAALDRSRHAALQDSVRSTKVTLDGIPGNVVVYQALKPDEQGVAHTVAFGDFGTVELDVFFASPLRPDQPRLTTWLDQQCTLLTGKAL